MDTSSEKSPKNSDLIRWVLMALLGVGSGLGSSYGLVSTREVAIHERLVGCETGQAAIEARLDREKVDFTSRMDRIDGRVDGVVDKWFPARPK